MPTPPKFSELFDELKATVASLEKRESELKGSNTLLEARHKFLTEELEKLDLKKQGLLKDIKELTKQLSDKQGDIDALDLNMEKQAEQSKAEHDEAVSKLQTEVDDKQNELDSINSDISGRLKTAKDLTTAKEQLETAIKAVEGKLSDKRINLKDIELEVEDARAKADADIINYESEVEASLSELKKVKSLIDEANDDLEFIKEQVATFEERKKAAYKQHVGFIEYESKARKVLNAKEESLIERENNLDMAVARAKRQNGILDKI
jgi:chromosome segregation ATPase